MHKVLKAISILLFFGFLLNQANACSILYYKDTATGKFYVANNEDYWYSTKAYLQINPKTKDTYARLWYGWDNFAQGGVNEFGLFFDGAATPTQPDIKGYHKPKGNLGDRILAHCKTVDEALNFLEQEKVALTNGHLFFGDPTGNAVVVEWVNGKKNLLSIENNYLIATNFLLSDTTKGNYPCQRYNAIKEGVASLNAQTQIIDIKQVGNIIAKAVQVPSISEENKTGGTLYSTFINLTDMEFILVYKLNNSNAIHLNLKEVFSDTKAQKINLKNLLSN